MRTVDVQSTAPDARPDDGVKVITDLEEGLFVLTARGSADKAAVKYTHADMQELSRQIRDMLWRNDWRGYK